MVDRLFVVVTGREHCSQGRVWVLIKLSLLINKYCGGLNDLVLNVRGREKKVNNSLFVNCVGKKDKMFVYISTILVELIAFCFTCVCLFYISSLTSFLRDIGKQCRPRSDATKRGV